MQLHADYRVIVRAGKGQKYRAALFLGQRGRLGARRMLLSRAPGCRIAALAEAAELKQVTPHVLRHTAKLRFDRHAATAGSKGGSGDGRGAAGAFEHRHHANLHATE